MIGIFNRSHYEDVLVVRVDELVPKEVWQARMIINAFERLLADSGVAILSSTCTSPRGTEGTLPGPAGRAR